MDGLVMIFLILAAFTAGYYYGCRQPRDERRECAVSYCHSLADQRCEGGNCTDCCASYGRCRGVCIMTWPERKAAADLERLERMAGER